MTQILTMPRTGIIQLAQLFKFVINFLGSLRSSYLYSMKVTETIKELDRLSNAELKDIGICRGDIYTIANSKSMSDYSDKISTKVEPNSNIKGWV
jgi:uncharacterized protein YjiS (DUF1127 family)